MTGNLSSFLLQLSGIAITSRFLVFMVILPACQSGSKNSPFLRVSFRVFPHTFFFHFIHQKVHMTTISNCTFAGSIHNEAFVAGLIHLQGTPISIDRERKRFFLKKADSAPMDANVESPSMHKYNNVVVVSGYKRLRTELPVTSPFALPLTQKEKKRRKARQVRKWCIILSSKPLGVLLPWN